MSGQTVLPSFDRPPVREVTISVQFKGLDGLSSVHFGEWWNEVRGEFPLSDDLQPLADVDDRDGDQFELALMPPLRRVRVSSKDKSLALQLQSSRFIANWAASESSPVYPHFENLFEVFETNYAKLLSFQANHSLSEITPTYFEVTYINELRDLGEYPLKTLSKLLRFCSWSEGDNAFLSQPHVVNYAWQFAMPNADGQLVLTLNPAKRSDGTKVILFALRCVGDVSKQIGNPTDWFQAAHICIVKAFTDLTTETAHQLWGKGGAQ